MRLKDLKMISIRATTTSLISMQFVSVSVDSYTNDTYTTKFISVENVL